MLAARDLGGTLGASLTICTYTYTLGMCMVAPASSHVRGMMCLRVRQARR